MAAAAGDSWSIASLRPINELLNYFRLKNQQVISGFLMITGPLIEIIVSFLGIIRSHLHILQKILTKITENLKFQNLLHWKFVKILVF